MRRIGSLFPLYTVVPLSVGLVTLLSLMLQAFLTLNSWLIFLIPVAISSWYGGMLYGAISTLLSVLVSDYLFVEPRFSLDLHNSNDLATILIFVLDATLFSWLNANLHNGKNKLELTLKELQENAARLIVLANLERQEALLERLLFEEILHKREEEMRLITDIVPALISYVDSQQCYRFHNKKYEEWLGLTKSEINGKHLQEVLGESVYQSIRPRIELVLAGNEVIYEGELPHQDGTVRITDVHYVPHINLAGIVEGFVVLVQDITDRKRDEKERELLLQCEQVARSQAETANRLKDEFLGTLSHELRTPLNAMLGWIQLLRCRKFDEATTNQALETIDRNSRALLQLIEDVLDVSRIIQGKLQLDIQPVELTRIIQSAINTVLPAANAKEISIQCQLDETVGTVMGDVHRLQQVLWNLLSNAVKFTPKKGKVCVQMQRMNSWVQIRVIDTGIGISAEFLPYVFERFRQADSSTTRGYSGLGLGLAIVRHLVELHGGTVDAKSPGINQGAVLIVNLPMKAVEVDQMTHQGNCLPWYDDRVKYPSSILAGLLLLVVDDEVDSCYLLSTILSNYGARVITALSAREAMIALTNFHPHALVSDIAMPEEDGYKLIHQVRSLPPEQGGQVPAIALTAYARPEDRHQALVAGFHLHIPKPVNPIELSLVVAQLVGRTL